MQVVSRIQLPVRTVVSALMWEGIVLGPLRGLLPCLSTYTNCNKQCVMCSSGSSLRNSFLNLTGNTAGVSVWRNTCKASRHRSTPVVLVVFYYLEAAPPSILQRSC